MKIIRWIFLVINFFFIFCALMAFWGSALSPEKFVVPAYFALIFPIVLFFNIGFVFLWMIFRKWYFLFSLVLLLFSSPKIKTVFPISIKSEAKEISDDSFSLFTYNTWALGRMEKHTEKSPNKVIQHIVNSDADIVCLQEFSVSPNFLTEAAVIKALKKYPYRHICYKRKRSYNDFGVATFSKYPIIKKETVDFPSNINSAIFSDIVIGKDTIRLINCHLESNRLTEQDKAMPANLRKKFDMENLSNVTMHLSRKLGAAYKIRAKQADMVAEYIENSPYKLIVCGDFNDVPLSYSYTKIRGNLQDAFETLECGIGATFHEKFYKFRIDYVLYDQNFIPLQFKREKVDYSDHYPLTCRLKITTP